MEKVKVIIELSREQRYFAYTDGWKYLTAYEEGATAQEAKENLLQAIEETKQYLKEEGESKEQLEYLESVCIEYAYDVRSFLKYYKILNITKVAQRIGINDVLMRQYKAGQYMSEARAQEIVKGLNDIGRELLAVHL